MRIYEEQRIDLDNGFLIKRGMLEERIKKLDSGIIEEDKKIRTEVKVYMNDMRSYFEDIATGTKLNKLTYHHVSLSENQLIIFPIKADSENIYKQMFDEEIRKFYVEI